jgi:hypothetical protein
MLWWSKSTARWKLPWGEHFHALRDIAAVALAVTRILPRKLLEDGTPVALAAAAISTQVFLARGSIPAPTAGASGEDGRCRNEK